MRGFDYNYGGHAQLELLLDLTGALISQSRLAWNYGYGLAKPLGHDSAESKITYQLQLAVEALRRAYSLNKAALTAEKAEKVTP
jgi:hypothetical protein